MSYCLLVAAAYVLGRLIWPDSIAPHTPERWFYRLLAGVSLCAVLVIAVGSYALTSAQLLLAAIALAGLFHAGVVRKNRSPEEAPAPTPHDPFSVMEIACLAVIGASLLMTFIASFAPVTSWDATVAHLALPADYQRHGSIYIQPGNVYSGYPHFMHSLYTLAYFSPSGGLERTAALLGWTFSALACYSIYLLGARVDSRRCGILAAAILATAPIFADQAAGTGIDLPFVVFSTAALTCVAEWFLATGGEDRQRRHWLLLAALLAGASCGIRHTGYLVVIFLGAAVLLGNSRRRTLNFLSFAGVALIASAPWWIRSALVTGNPVFPFLLSWFPAGPIDHIAIGGVGAHESIGGTGGISLWQFVRFPWDIIMRMGSFDGWSKSPGGLVLILGLPGLLVGGKRARWLGMYSASGGAVFFFFQRFARYLLPFFVPAMVIAAMAALRLPRLKWVVGPVIALSFVYGLALEAAALQIKAPVLLGLQTRHDYLEERIERYAAFDYANAYLNDGGVILSIDQRSYFLEARTFQNHWSLKRISQVTFREQLDWLQRNGIRYVIVPVDYLLESGALQDIAPMVDNWRRSRYHFERLTTLEVPRLHGKGVERVEIYRLRNL
ncbi:MAG: glycosyltransferase family 39 protein [Candidatus Hydrogenedentes bacterium]|nr:glycosyltransferase family 39 protein [Candidatus Hydrogenedentota bacterium]